MKVDATKDWEDVHAKSAKLGNFLSPCWNCWAPKHQAFSHQKMWAFLKLPRLVFKWRQVN